MTTGFTAVLVVFLLMVTSARAHRLDEFLQATTIALAKDHVTAQMRLTPGVEVVRTVLADIDKDGDGILSEAEQHTYAERVRQDLALTVDGNRLTLRLVSATFPEVEEMRQGLGDIELRFEADLPRGGPGRRLTFENSHAAKVSAYLVNCLVPSDPAIRVIAQSRNFAQSFYQLDYTQDAPGPTTSNASTENPPDHGVLFEAYFYHGVHHILTGYDHLLFVSALVLAAVTFWDLVKVVSAFTLAHTITLTLAALNLVHVPGRVVEPLISASIVFVAAQNVFWPSRAQGWSRLGAAFFFGLFHGLGFAGGLLDTMRALPGATMFLAILAFGIGVETGHQMVVLPLFASLKAARWSQVNAGAGKNLTGAFRRIGSAGISLVGFYYLCVALGGHPWGH